MKERSCLCTVSIQLALCIAVYVTLNIGSSQDHSYRNTSPNNGRQVDTFFITVAGGYRPLKEQTLLLKQMVDAAKIYKAQFVIDITEYGESDPLLHNATLYPELQLMPWYTTGASEEQGGHYFLKRIIFPYGQTLDIIAVDTVLFQDPSSLPGRNQIRWVSRILKESESDWKIVVGFHQLAPCENQIRKLGEETPFNLLQKMLIHYGVDAYLARETCSGRFHGGSVGLSTDTSPVDKSLYLITLNQTLVHKREARGGFLLHRVNNLEMTTFFVNSTGESEHQVSFQQRGKAVM